MDAKRDAGERAMIARHVWELARAQGDDRLRGAALREYRDAMGIVRKAQRGGQTLREAMASETREPYR